MVELTAENIHMFIGKEFHLITNNENFYKIMIINAIYGHNVKYNGIVHETDRGRHSTSTTVESIIRCLNKDYQLGDFDLGGID